jgi:hypothetical protein
MIIVHLLLLLLCSCESLIVFVFRELVYGQLLRLPDQYQASMAAQSAQSSAQQPRPAGGESALPPATESRPMTSVVQSGDS